MPKAEKGTAKDIANRMKAKGLQKLKFYCQMCQKQCRDANGFKCHMTSESHLRNMQIFSSNAGGMLDGMSREFETVFCSMLRMRHGTSRVNANNVYQEVIQDKHHIHMNATKWTSLSTFVQYLGKTGKCVVEETERGWYVQYIERDASKLARQEALQRRLEAEQTAERRYEKQMEIQRQEAAKALGGDVQVEATSMEPRDETKSVAISLSKATSDSNKRKTAAVSVFGGDDDEDEEEEQPKPPIPPVESKPKVMSKSPRPPNVSGTKQTSEPSKKKTKMDDENRKENWVRRDILVRIISKKLAGGKYFKRKAVVDKVLDDKFTAEVEVLDSGPNAKDGGDILRLDQDDLATVIPKEGKTVKILNGRGRGKQAKLLELDADRYRAVLELTDGSILKKVDYEDFSKMAWESSNLLLLKNELARLDRLPSKAGIQFMNKRRYLLELVPITWCSRRIIFLLADESSFAGLLSSGIRKPGDFPTLWGEGGHSSTQLFAFIKSSPLLAYPSINFVKQILMMKENKKAAKRKRHVWYCRIAL